MARQVLENGVILPAEYSDDWYDDMTSNLTKLDDVIGSDSEKLSTADVGAAALSNNYNDLDNLPTIPTVNDATLTIQKNGVDVQTFTANASSNVTANITVPTKTSDLTNDSNFVDTSNSAVSSGITSAKVTSYDSHIADTDIHVTAADKSKWNNGVSQSYVLRYSSSSVTDNSTIAYSTLDNTDNVKASDKIIDADGKIFSIVSVDTANQTVTVGSALIDLALDANVVHTSGNETIGGTKTFSDLQIIAYGTQYKGAKDAYILPEFSAGYSGLSITTLSYPQTLKIGNFVLDANNKPSLDTSKGYIQIATGKNNGVNACTLEARNSTSSLGASANRWSKIYGTEYYYGSNNVEFSTKFVTTDTAQTITGAKTFSGNINVYNSDSTADTANIVLKNSKAERGSTTDIGEQTISFLDKDNAQIGQIKCEVDAGGVSTLTVNCTNSSNSSSGIRLRRTSTGTFLQPTYNNGCNLGTNGYRWYDVQTRAVNGVEPSSLGMPDLSNSIDISSYITDLTGAPNVYSSPANGYIVLRSTTANVLGIVENTTGMGSYSRGSNQVLAVNLPVVKNSSISIYAICSSLTQAKFIPCQGNV